MAKNKSNDLSRHKTWMKKNNKVNIILVLDRNKREEINAAAERVNLSTNLYVLRAIEQQMTIDKMPDNMGVIINNREIPKNGV